MRKLCFFALPFSAAVLLAVYLFPARLWLPLGLISAAAFLPGLVLRGNGRLRWTLICFGLAAGFLWSSLFYQTQYAPAEALDGQAVTATASVLDYPRTTTYGCTLNVRLPTGNGTAKASLLLAKEYASLKPGDQISGTFQLNTSTELYGEETDYYTAKGIFLLASAEELTVEHPAHIPLSAFPVVMAEKIKISISTVFPADTAPFITAILTGDKTGLESSLYTAMQRSGVAHVVAVSGMHVSFLAGLVATLLSRRRRLAAVTGIVLVLLFAAVTGATPSVLRAAFMQVFLLLAPLLRREDDRATSLSAVLMLLLAANPFSAASVSLQLSFASVAGIYLFTQPLYTKWMEPFSGKTETVSRRWRNKTLAFLFGSLSTTIGAMMFTTPLTAYYFGTFSILSPLTNLLTLWAVSFVFLGGLFTALLGILSPGLAAPFAFLTSIPVRYICLVVTRIARIPFAAVSTGGIYLKLWLYASYAVLLHYLLYRVILRRKITLRQLGIPAVACALALCAALAFQALSLRAGTLTVTVLNVGQGQSLVLHSANQTVLVDCGGNGQSSAGDIAADYLQSMGSSHLDYLVLTHCHTDHANGVAELMSRIDVSCIVLPDVQEPLALQDEITALAAERGITLVTVEEDTAVTFGDDVDLRIYAPLGAGETNEEGLSLLCTSGDFDVLITGDMDSTIERRLIKYGNLPDIELLIAGHHGSKYATSEELLAETLPEYAAISVGRNSYGHPADETLARLAEQGCAIYRTDRMGNITFTIR
ncbi:MAG: DNA internalization-related competence protein ComEC/Rec2 [Oscillospiraceae bacterium]|nr:DNA internalization-related competence protein ComEC/Rec2 [Oscillospiraceae bacterium]